MHARTLATHSGLKTQELEAQAHQLWTEKQTQRSIGRDSLGPLMPCPACAQGDAL